MDDEKALEYIVAIVAIVTLGIMANYGALDPGDAIKYILAIVGYIIGKDILIQTYRAYKTRAK
jgi:type IV secretory pathway VirB2 component (pilin)